MTFQVRSFSVELWETLYQSLPQYHLFLPSGKDKRECKIWSFQIPARMIQQILWTTKKLSGYQQGWFHSYLVPGLGHLIKVWPKLCCLNCPALTNRYSKPGSDLAEHLDGKIEISACISAYLKLKHFKANLKTILHFIPNIRVKFLTWQCKMCHWYATAV